MPNSGKKLRDLLAGRELIGFKKSTERDISALQRASTAKVGPIKALQRASTAKVGLVKTPGTPKSSGRIERTYRNS